tara:strand:+ start:205 stop:492 length:288 start_codon:yes stop_codon:yes gene_type:complete
MRVEITKEQYELLLTQVTESNRKLFTPLCTWYGDEYKFDDEQDYWLIIDDLKGFLNYVNLDSYEAVNKKFGLTFAENKTYTLYKDIIRKINKEDK